MLNLLPSIVILVVKAKPRHETPWIAWSNASAAPKAAGVSTSADGSDISEEREQDQR